METIRLAFDQLIRVIRVSKPGTDYVYVVCVFKCMFYFVSVIVLLPLWRNER